jgi:hypothetical protein
MLHDPLPNMQWTAPAMVGAIMVLLAPVAALVAAFVAALNAVLVIAPVAALDAVIVVAAVIALNAVLVVAPVAPMVVLGLLEEWQHARPVPPLSNVIRLYSRHCLVIFYTMDQISMKTPNPQCRLFLKIDQ